MTIDTVLLKVASRCNIDCQYCYVYQSEDQGWRRQPGRFSEATVKAVIERLAELREDQQQPLTVLLHGGEPLLLGKSRLDNLLRRLRILLGWESTIAIQTNGILLDSDFVELLAETRTRVGVSLDGPSSINDKFRVDHQGRSTFQNTLRGIELLRSHPLSTEFFCGILAVIDPYSDPEEVYRFFKSLKVPSIDFLVRDGNHESLPYGKKNFYSVEYGHWLSRLWEVYIEDPEPVPIECLDNQARLMLGSSGTKEGSGITDFGILVVDTDGTITKNDTLKNSHDGADLFSKDWSVHRNSFLEVANSDEFLQYRASQRTLHSNCLQCRHLPVCGGGMVLHRWSKERQYDNPSVYCKDQIRLYSQIGRTFRSLFE